MQLLVCGQALSHCVNSTFTDILSTYPVSQRKNLVLLTDGTFPLFSFCCCVVVLCDVITVACSSVGGFEANGSEFVTRIKAAGCKTSTTTACFGSEASKGDAVRGADSV